MYEKFSDRARKVLQLANQEAQRLCHEAIGTEHILIGIIKEGSGVAASVLKNLDVDLRKVRLEVEKLVQAGPDMVTFGKLPHTPRAKKVIEFALDEARALKHNHVGTEHLLLGLLREGEGVAAQVLMSLGISLEKAREGVLTLIGNFDKPEVQKVFEGAPFMTWTMNIQQAAQSTVPAWLNGAKDYYVGQKQDFDSAAEARDLMEKLNTVNSKYKKSLLRDELEQCKRRQEEIEKELGDAGAT